MNKFKSGDKVSLIPGCWQYLPDSRLVNILTLIVDRYTDNQGMFIATTYNIKNKELFNFDDNCFELSYTKEFSNKLESILNEEN